MDRHTWGMWLIQGPLYHKDKQSQSFIYIFITQITYKFTWIFLFPFPIDAILMFSYCIELIRSIYLYSSTGT